MIWISVHCTASKHADRSRHRFHLEQSFRGHVMDQLVQPLHVAVSKMGLYHDDDSDCNGRALSLCCCTKTLPFTVPTALCSLLFECVLTVASTINVSRLADHRRGQCLCVFAGDRDSLCLQVMIRWLDSVGAGPPMSMMLSLSLSLYLCAFSIVCDWLCVVGGSGFLCVLLIRNCSFNLLFYYVTQ